MPRKLAIAAATLVTIAVAIVGSVAFNPYMTARPRAGLGVLSADERELVSQNPWRRFLAQVDHRMILSDSQKKTFPNDALSTLPQKLEVFAIQGFGRFGPLGPFESDSRVRFSPGRTGASLSGWPLVLCGVVETIRLGRAQLTAGRPPSAAVLS